MRKPSRLPPPHGPSTNTTQYNHFSLGRLLTGTAVVKLLITAWQPCFPNAKHHNEKWRVHVDLSKCVNSTVMKENPSSQHHKKTSLKQHSLTPIQSQTKCVRMSSWHPRVSLQNSTPEICQRCRRNATQLLLHATITIYFPEQHEINSDTTHQAPPSHGQTNRSNLRRLVSGSKTFCRLKTSLPQPPTCMIVFCWTRSLACV